MISNYLGSGTYGCTIRPSFDCDIKKNLLIDKTIAKIFSNKNYYKDEIKQHLLISKIDKNNSFTIKLINHCKIDLSYINKNVNNFDRCKLIKNNKIIYQIIYEDGGIDLEVFFTQKRPNFDSYQFLKKFISLFYGIQLLINNELSHSDIKMDNLLFNGEKIILIDFGLLIKFKELLNDRIAKINYKNIYFYPDEYNLYYKNNLFNQLLNSDELFSRIDEYMYLIEHLSNQYNYLNYFQQINNLNSYLKSQAFLFASKFNKTTLNKKKEELCILFGKKLDIYQLGIVLYSIILSIIYLYDINEINKIPLGIFDIIKKMLEPDVNIRIDIQTLINNYSKLFT